jgi:outer membrane protein assembly factor BamB
MSMNRRSRRSRLPRVAAALVAAALAIAGISQRAEAVATSYWRVQSPWQFRSGDRDGVAIHSDGRVALGPEARSVLDEGDLYVWSLFSWRGAIYAGTGDDGKVYRVDAGGKAEMIWDTIALEVTSLAAGKDGTLYAGTAPDATIYSRSPQGRETTLADTPEQLVWTILVADDGTIFAGTGNGGCVYRIKPGNNAERFFDPNDGHVLALAWGRDGKLVAGTGGRGLLYEITGDGKGRVLYDTDQDEVRAVAVAEDGRIYFAANGSSARSPQEKKEQKGKPREGEVAIGEIRLSGQDESRPPELQGEGSALYAVDPDGGVSMIWKCPEDFIYTLRMEPDGRILVSTGENGGLYRISPGGEAEHVIEVEESQVLALAEQDGRIYIGTGNPGRVQVLTESRRREGTLVSPVHDAHSVAQWGTVEVEAQVPEGTRLLVSTRSGNTHEPDETWSEWSDEAPAERAALVRAPAARFLQWKLRLVSENGERSPEAMSVQVAYLEQNLAPRVSSVEVGGKPGEFFVSGFEGRSQSVTQVLPGGIEIQYSVSEPQEQKATDDQLSWVRGLRTARWEASDPNGDNLVFRIYYRGEGERRWKDLAKDLTDRIYTWDATSFPDGRYELKIVSSDERSNPKDISLEGERTSRLFDIDNTPPSIGPLEARPAEGGRLRVTGVARDGASRILRLEYSVDGGRWVEFSPGDRIFDSREEAFDTVTDSLSSGEHAVVVKVVDESLNVGSAKAVVR